MIHSTRRAFVEFGCRCDGCRAWAIISFGKHNTKPAVPRARTWSSYVTLPEAKPYRRILVALRREGVPMRKVAQVTGVSLQSLYKIEAGETQHVFLDTSEKLRRMVALLPNEVSA